VVRRRRQQQWQDATSQMRASFWTRHFPVNPLMILGAAVVIVVFIALPIYVYKNKLSAGVCASNDAQAPNSSAPPSQAPGRRLLEMGELSPTSTVLWG
jgi:hypothetical protein